MNAARLPWRLAGALALVALTGCATLPAGSPAARAVADPWENWNRKVFAFNEALDRAVLEPVAQTYQDVVPRLARVGVDNLLGNLYDVWSTANQFLQGKMQVGLEMGMRVVTNTLFGLGGLLDPATEMGLTRRSDDFGQTLGRWGLPNGPYIVLPLFGPSTLRDTAGFVVDRQASPSSLPDSAAGRYSVSAIELINKRTQLLATGQMLDQVALDKYSFVRNAYLASRRDALFDGAPPMDAFIDEGADPPAAPAPPASAPAR